MSELNLKQISDKLNSEFTGDVRKLVFWYDANAEFQEDVDTLELENAKVLHLEADNQFYIKYFLECVDTTTNYLVYAPFSKPGIRDNHLADTIRYSKEFFADRASLITVDLGIDDRFKPVIQRYVKFFDNKTRTQRFYDFEIEHFSRSTIEIALLSVLCKSKTPSFEEVVRSVFTDGELNDNVLLAEFEKFGLLSAFWKQVEIAYGYCDPEPTLMKLAMTMFITYASKSIHAEMPEAWKPFISYKSGSIIVFLDSMMNSYLYGKKFNEISATVFQAINGAAVLSRMDEEALLDCELFVGIDSIILGWLNSRLEIEDIGAKLNGKTIPEICSIRSKKHFGGSLHNEYYALKNAFYLMVGAKYHPSSSIKEIVHNYLKKDFQVDRWYRCFYYYFDQIENTVPYESVRDLAENIYTNDYLNQITVNWNQEMVNGETGLPLQRDFYNRYVSRAKDRIAVIISDAFRYEAAATLFEKLKADEQCTASLEAVQGVLPSYTPLGMAALLPHRTLEYTSDYEVLIDGKPCASTEQRQAILRAYRPNSRCVQFDMLKNMKQSELRPIFTGQDVVYIYHNQVDARGDAAKTENEVFTACEEAIEEIHKLIRSISSMANTHHFLITADHGFIYKRDRLAASDKISTSSGRSNSIGQRYAITGSPIQAEGVCSTTIGQVLGTEDNRIVSYPLASDIFKVAGAGQNFVHGGCSPQEMIVPVVEVKVEKSKMDTTFAQIALVSLVSKITNLITTLDFVQTEPITDIVKKTTYRICFISEDNEKISNEIICNADKKDSDTAKRIFRFRFNFKNKQYDKKKKYYLVVFDDQNNIEIIRHEIVIDIAMADDFGFF